MSKRPLTPPGDDESHDELLRTVALRLREARMGAELTQTEVGEKAGLKKSYVFELESGKSNMTLKTLSKMAGAFGLVVRDLLPGGGLGEASAADLMSLRVQIENLSALLADRQQKELTLMEDLGRALARALVTRDDKRE